MKKIIYYIIMILGFGVFFSCQKEINPQEAKRKGDEFLAKRDTINAFLHYTVGATNGDIESQICLGELYLKQPWGWKRAEAEFWLLKAGNKDNIKAQSLLSKNYLAGNFARVNVKKAIEWAKKASNNGRGDAESQFTLYLAYNKGVKDVVEQNTEQAIKWLKKSAQGGNAEAQLFLGISYGKGEKIERNIVECKYWLRKSASQGNKEAKRLLGKLLKIIE